MTRADAGGAQVAACGRSGPAGALGGCQRCGAGAVLSLSARGTCRQHIRAGKGVWPTSV